MGRTIAPLNINIGGDTEQITGNTSGDLGTTISQGVLVNPWAKYKYVKYNAINNGHCLTGKTKAPDSPYWKGYNGQCGFKIDSFTATGNPGTSGSFFNKLLAGQLPWTYDKPTGGNYPFRILDADGYNKDVDQPMHQSYIESVMVGTGTADGQLKLEWPADTRSDGGDAGNIDYIRLSDMTVNNLATFDKWYFSVLIYVSSSQYSFISAPVALKDDGGWGVTFTGMNAYKRKKATVVPFLSSVKLAQGTAVSNGTYVSFNLDPIAVSIEESSSGIEVTFMQNEWNTSLTSVSYQVSLSNQNNSARTVANIMLALVESNTPNPNAGTTIASRTVASTTVPASGSTSISGTFTPANGWSYNPSKFYFLTIISSGSTLIPFNYDFVQQNIEGE